MEYHSLQRVTCVTWRDMSKCVALAFQRFDVPALFLVLLSILLLPSLLKCQLGWYPDLPLEPVGFHMLGFGAPALTTAIPILV